MARHPLLLQLYIMEIYRPGISPTAKAVTLAQTATVNSPFPRQAAAKAAATPAKAVTREPVAYSTAGNVIAPSTV